MADYRKCTCIACKTEFDENDDIVVCPECGTPYHRDCWNDYGHCINYELHEKGESWSRPQTSDDSVNNQESGSEKTDEILCPFCGKKNPKSAAFCIHCGGNMKQAESYAQRNGSEGEQPFFGRNGSEGEQPFFGRNGAVGSQTINPDEDMGGVTAAEVSDFTGSNSVYFLTRFRYFFQSAKKFAPNFVCIFFPQLWFAYRKMWVPALLTVFAAFILGIPGSIMAFAEQADIMLSAQSPIAAMFGAAGTQELLKHTFSSVTNFVEENYTFLYWANIVSEYLLMIMKVLLFAFGNFIYYRYSVKKIKAVREDESSLMDVQSRIRLAGGTSIGMIFIILLISAVPAGLLSFILLNL